jgi:hypothetical protein
MQILPLVLQLAALACLLFAAVGLLPTSKVAWGWAGLFFWLLSLMISAIQLHPIAR